jgi:hypothetical protein
MHCQRVIRALLALPGFSRETLHAANPANPVSRQITDKWRKLQ